MVGSFYYYYYEPYPPPEGYQLTLSISEVLPPGNDSFADATVITGLPFEEWVDTTAATLEAGESVPSCADASFGASVWYTYTPTVSGPVSALVPDYYFEPAMAVYSGMSLSDLTELNCHTYDGRMTIYGEAGTTYFYQLGGMWDGRGQVHFRLEVTPPPYVGLYYDPGDPSSYDTIQFWGDYWDPGNVGIASVSWDFGDGITATSPDNWISHRYAADGDYTVSLTVTTYDGRNASVSQVVPVRTHDVAITRVTAPKSASVGQTRPISVYIRNYRYLEQVTVHLSKSVPGGYAWVGDLSQQVPVRNGNRTTRFDFTYTFTLDDVQMGKVTFKAVAEVLTGRDALPADNEAISPPTKVNR
jgi:hypothetical protein